MQGLVDAKLRREQTMQKQGNRPDENESGKNQNKEGDGNTS